MSNDRKMSYNDLIRLASETASRVAIETVQEERKRVETEVRDHRLRNTKLLLKNYRVLKAHCDKAVYSEEQITRVTGYENPVNVLMSMESGEDSVYVESIRKSARRTRLIMNHVDEMLRIYKAYCDATERAEIQRRYGIIHHFYVSEDKKTGEQLAALYNINKRTVYKDKRVAEERISALIFGIDWIQ